MPNDDPLLPPSLLHPLLPQALYDALSAVRSRGAYYGGAPTPPGPAVRPGFGVDPARFPVVSGPRNESPAGMGLIGANQNLRPEISERAGVLTKLIANRDFMPRISGGRMHFRSLTPGENEIINRVGWPRAPSVAYQDETSSDPLTARRAWEQNIKHWFSLTQPSGE